MHTSTLEVRAPSGPRKILPALLALMPAKWRSRVTGESITVQGSPGFQCVYLSVDDAVVAIPLDLAQHVGAVLQLHAAEAVLRTSEHLQART